MWSQFLASTTNGALILWNGISSSLHGTDCRVLPGDPSWPSSDIWNTFNHSVDGHLIKSIPIGSPCHNPTFDAEQCEFVRKNWRKPFLHEENPSSIMDPIFLNDSCDPFSGPDDQCIVGSYVSYVVNVSAISHVVKTLDFAKKHNIRFVIKNTGHDYMGKSTAKGGLSVWMHHLRDIEFIDDFASSLYKGRAIKVHAGVTGEQLAKAASEKGLMIVGGECPTVGFTGGYIQSGGHSVLSSTHGLAADQALSYEVITPAGEFVVASPQENQDLYWALSGGGAGNYGIVWSVTVKAFKDVPVTVGSLAFSAEGISPDTYWKAITAYQKHSVKLTDAKAFTFAFYSVAGFSMDPIFAPGLTTEQLNTLLEPLLSELRSLNIQFVTSANTHPGYVQAYNSVAAFQQGEIANFQISSRLLPRSLWETTSTISAMTETLRGIAESGGIFLDIAVRPTLEVAGYPNNSVLPAWRDTERTFGIILPLVDGQSQEQSQKDQATLNSLGETLRKLAPDSGAYMNEASPVEPNFKRVFYGSNYNALLAIKQTWDPEHVLYGSTSVGGDLWHQTDEGRLCKKPWWSRIWGEL